MSADPGQSNDDETTDSFRAQVLEAQPSPQHDFSHSSMASLQRDFTNTSKASLRRDFANSSKTSLHRTSGGNVSKSHLLLHSGSVVFFPIVAGGEMPVNRPPSPDNDHDDHDDHDDDHDHDDKNCGHLLEAISDAPPILLASARADDDTDSDKEDTEDDDGGRAAPDWPAVVTLSTDQLPSATPQLREALEKRVVLSSEAPVPVHREMADEVDAAALRRAHEAMRASLSCLPIVRVPLGADAAVEAAPEAVGEPLTSNSWQDFRPMVRRDGGQAALPVSSSLIFRNLNQQFYHGLRGFTWVDVCGILPPVEYQSYLSQLCEHLSLHPAVVRDIMSPHALPLIEKHGRALVMICRLLDSGRDPDATGTTVRNVSRKCTFIILKDFVMTIHHRPVRALSHVQRAWSRKYVGCSLSHVINKMLQLAVTDFSDAVDDKLGRLEAIENSVFTSDEIFSLAFRIKLRAGCLLRLLDMTDRVIAKYQLYTQQTDKYAIELRTQLHSALSKAEELRDSAQAVLSMHLSYSAHVTNNVFYTLSVVSVCIMPPAFLAGQWGMNFVYIPLLGEKWGYPFAWACFVIVVFGFLIFFKLQKF